MSLSSKEYFLKETYRSVKHNGLMSFASVSTVALSLLVLGIFLILVLNANNMASHLEGQVQISVYMRDNATTEEIRAADTGLRELPGVNKVVPVDKTEAMSRFRERLGDQRNLLDALGTDNPFPNSFEVQVDKPENIKAITPRIEKMPGVETVRYGQDIVEQLFKMTKLLRYGGSILVLLLAMATLFIISNTIRITVFARRKEVNIMKYVGATDWFIRWPFLLEGMFLGFMGGIIASLVLLQLYLGLQNWIHTTLAFFPMIQAWPFMGYMFIFLILIGTIIGAVGSSISLKKFLEV